MKPQTRNLVDSYIIPEKRQSVKMWKNSPETTEKSRRKVLKKMLMCGIIDSKKSQFKR